MKHLYGKRASTLLQCLGAQTKTVRQTFHTTDRAVIRRHTDDQNLMQAIYQIIASPTLSRFYNRMDGTDRRTQRAGSAEHETLKQFTAINKTMRDVVYSVCSPEYILFDIDSILLNTYGKQEGEALYEATKFSQICSFPAVQYVSI